MEDKELQLEQNEQPTEQVEETYKEMSPIKLILRRFFRSRLSIVGLVMLVFLFAFSFLGPVIYNRWGEITVDDTPVITYVEEELTYVNEYGEVVTVTQIIEIVDINLKAAPSWDHLLGTDEKGMDVFVRLMYGGRISLTIGFIVVFFETILGVI